MIFVSKKIGQLYDEHGELRNWWTNNTRKLFAEKADCFVDQYSNFSINSAKVWYWEIMRNLKSKKILFILEISFQKKNHQVNGVQTLAENIADNGGLREAYRVS